MPKSIAIVPTQKPKAQPALGMRGQRTAEVLEREIEAAARSLERANKDFWKASKLLARDGVAVVKTVTDSKGYAFKKRGVNSAVRILAAAERARKIYTGLLAELRMELEAINKPKATKDATDNFFDEDLD